MRRYVAPLEHIILNPSQTVLLRNDAQWAEKKQIPILLVLGLTRSGSNPWFTALETSTQKITKKNDITMKYTHCSKYLFNKSIALEISFCALAIVTSLFLANYNGKSLWYQYISKQMIDILNLFKIRSHHLIRPFFFFNQIYIYIIYLSNW